MSANEERKMETRDGWSLLKRLVVHLQGYYRSLIVVSIVILLYTLIATYQPIVIQQVLDLLLADPQSELLTTLVILFFLVSLLVWLLDSINTWLIADIATKLVDTIRKQAFGQLMAADMTFHHKNTSGEITSRVISDSSQIASGLTIFTQLLTQITLIIATFIVLLSIGWQFVLIALVGVPVALIISKVIGSIGRKRTLKVRQAYGIVSSRLAELLDGVSVAKSFNQEDRLSTEMAGLNQKTYEYMKSMSLVFILIFPSVAMVSTLLVFGVMWVGGLLYQTGAISIGRIFLAIVMTERFLSPILNLSTQYTQLQSSLAALDRLLDIIESRPSIQEHPHATPLILSEGSVSFDQVHFGYNHNEVLQNISFEIKGGSKVALVGHTGAGKTTITSLLLRFYDPKQGAIRIDEQELTQLSLQSLYDNISLVSQESYLFSGTILENIRYGNPDATDTIIFQLCELIGADEFILALPEGYEFEVVEGGMNLSAGQRQMITIARTMLADPKILVLDEATSRLDNYSESLVQRAQRMLFRDRTTLIIAHRLSTIRDVDQIVVLEQGAIIEMGTHEELIGRNGKYAELYQTYYSYQGL